MYVVIDDPEQIRKVLSSKYHIDKPESVYANFKVVEGMKMLNIGAKKYELINNYT